MTANTHPERSTISIGEIHELLALFDAAVVRLEDLIVFYEDAEESDDALKVAFLIDRAHELLLRFAKTKAQNI